MNDKLNDAQELYEIILETANKFLRNAQLFEIHVLQGHKPSYEELAEIMDMVAHIVFELADDIDPMLAQKANDYVYLMRKMAIAITNDEGVILFRVGKGTGRETVPVATKGVDTMNTKSKTKRLYKKAFFLLDRAKRLLDEAYENHLKATTKKAA